MLITTLFGLVTVALSFAVVAEYGAIGVAAATALGLALQCIAMWGWVRRAFGVWTHPLWALMLRPHTVKTYF
jgi:O-antigen/teichoic acid export membrane protein